MGEAIDPNMSLIARPVKTVLRVGWSMRDGYVVCDVPYGKFGAECAEPDDEEFDGLRDNEADGEMRDIEPPNVEISPGFFLKPLSSDPSDSA
ncbi:hypothetical protein ACFU96_40910 [Streptomyces sp. NPDC057620]|uniref:hypothetical protein n=1 Tax=Streptomyces sp. NPDC057620 TaxID=3346185 RepID=UPI003684405E